MTAAFLASKEDLGPRPTDRPSTHLSIHLIVPQPPFDPPDDMLTFLTSVTSTYAYGQGRTHPSTNVAHVLGLSLVGRRPWGPRRSAKCASSKPSPHSTWCTLPKRSSVLPSPTTVSSTARLAYNSIASDRASPSVVAPGDAPGDDDDSLSLVSSLRPTRNEGARPQRLLRDGAAVSRC